MRHRCLGIREDDSRLGDNDLWRMECDVGWVIGHRLRMHGEVGQSIALGVGLLTSIIVITIVVGVAGLRIFVCNFIFLD
jgi:hypothetical protein